MIRRNACLTVAVLGLGITPALADNRTFVSGKGNDGNPCTRDSPCRSLQAAVNVTPPNGEVVVLDPAGYGTLIITQPVTIANDGVGTAAITVAANQIGVVVQTSGANDLVHLRGLEIDGGRVGTTGIQVTSNTTLEVVNCVISNFTSYGIATSAAMLVDRSTITNNQFGIMTQGSSTTTIVRSVLSESSQDGLYITSPQTAFLDGNKFISDQIGVQGAAGSSGPSANPDIYTLKSNSFYFDPMHYSNVNLHNLAFQ